MRVTQTMWQRSLMSSINRSYQRMADIDLRRRIVKASDDPAGTEQLVRLRTMLSHNELYQKNVSSASRWLSYTENALNSVTESYRAARDIALAASDDTNALDSLNEQLDGIIQSILHDANTNQGGRYLFSGGMSGVVPFTETTSGVVYNGDETELSTAISSGLSLRYNVPGSEIFGPREAHHEGTLDWNPEANWNTPLARLFDGNGLEAGLVRITDGGGTVAVVDLSGSNSLADIRDRIQAAQPGMVVDLTDGERLEIRDPAHPGENILIEDVQGGSTAQVLGLAGTGMNGTLIGRDLDPSIDDDTPLSELRGFDLPLGSIGVRIDGALEATELDLSGAVTVGDLRDAFNAAFPELDAEIAASGSRLDIHGTGFRTFAIENLDGDTTAEKLGLLGAVTPNRPFGVLYDLKEAIESDDRDTVRALLPELDAVLDRVLNVRASAGTRLNLAEDAQSTLAARNFTMTETISEIGDVDMAEALLMYQSAESVYQTSLVLASNIYQLTLANYL